MNSACKICRIPERRRLVDAALAEGVSWAAISRRESATGFPLGADTVARHAKQHYMAPPPASAKTRRDIASMVAERTADWLDQKKTDAGEPIGPDSPNWGNAVGPGLQAQRIIDTREARTDNARVMIAFAQLLSGMQGGATLAPVERRLLPATVDIEGEYEEVDAT